MKGKTILFSVLVFLLLPVLPALGRVDRGRALGIDDEVRIPVHSYPSSNWRSERYPAYRYRAPHAYRGRPRAYRYDSSRERYLRRLPDGKIISRSPRRDFFYHSPRGKTIYRSPDGAFMYRSPSPGGKFIYRSPDGTFIRRTW